MNAVNDKVLAQTRLFEAALPALLSEHRGEWVVFLDGAQSFHETQIKAFYEAIRRFGAKGGFVVAAVEEVTTTPLSAACLYGSSAADKAVAVALERPIADPPKSFEEAFERGCASAIQGPAIDLGSFAQCSSEPESSRALSCEEWSALGEILEHPPQPTEALRELLCVRRASDPLLDAADEDVLDDRIEAEASKIDGTPILGDSALPPDVALRIYHGTCAWICWRALACVAAHEIRYWAK